MLPSGPNAWLVESDDPLGLVAAIDAHRAEAPAPVEDVVPAARTVLVTFVTTAGRSASDWLGELATVAAEAVDAGAIDIPVHYDGEDLDAVATATGMGVAEVVARHTAGAYVSAFCGFAPGFAYLTGLDERLVLPRRATPRTRVPAGAVAIASEYTAVYPSPSPGGWHLLGRTDAALWDLDRDPPALLAPGTRVRFVAVA